MIPIKADTFSEVFDGLTALMRSAPQVKTERWQGVDVRNNPAATSYELLNVQVGVDLRGRMDLQHWRDDVRPNLPWADDHFLERVGGEPLNPGEEWRNWPWAGSAAKFRDPNERFNHSYAERLWPKFARATEGGKLPWTDGRRRYPAIPGTTPGNEPMMGLAWEYGDLRDLVDLLVAEPHTRQAWIPLFWPEDTGVADGGRKPCTLGYQFIVRDFRAHIYYPLRSCDLVRHFRDDVYLAIRLLIWVIEQCRRENPGFWGRVSPGTYTMHMTSLHVFENDMIKLRRGEPI